MPKTSVAEKLKNVDLTGDAMTAADNVLKTLGVKPKASAAQKEQARKARKGASIAANGKRKITTPKASAPTPTAAPLATADRSQLVGGGGVAFRAADYMSGDIWVPDARIPAIDESTYEQHKTRAQGQSDLSKWLASTLKTSTACTSSKVKPSTSPSLPSRTKPSTPNSKALKSTIKLRYRPTVKSHSGCSRRPPSTKPRPVKLATPTS